MLCLSGCSLLPVEEKQLKPPLAKPAEQKIETVEVKQGDIVKQVTGVAAFVSDKMDYLFFKQSGGRLSRINVQLGAKVKAGDVLVSTETDELEADVRLQEIEIEKIKIELEQALAEKGQGDPAVKMKLLDLESAQIQLNLLKKQLEQTRLISSVDGIVTYIEPMELGEQVSAYKKLVTISDPTERKLLYEASDRGNLAGVQINMKVSVKLNDKTYQGKVVQTPSTAPASNNEAIDARNAKSVVIDVQGLPSGVNIGDQADITIVTEKRDQVLIIPRSGLRTYLDRDYVQVLDGESRKEIDVEKGIVTDTEVEIRKGLSAGQKVILAN
ncbi:HlyD family efflux transporter periplasmic adaptor subunit [Paenibacillus sp. IB182493]|uniref:HlyD family efflux transporter periplasmic adaptor subunit n=2 Tax=Paenibacillus arenilitoris TaxID=2772299 RepID=A0A927CLS5_9BACL|nr:HlyD family efflux transporter periplasmic adaptor subunit [Paenibacillus arenilitoris]